MKDFKALWLGLLCMSGLAAAVALFLNTIDASGEAYGFALIGLCVIGGLVAGVIDEHLPDLRDR